MTDVRANEYIKATGYTIPEASSVSESTANEAPNSIYGEGNVGTGSTDTVEKNCNTQNAETNTNIRTVKELCNGLYKVLEEWGINLSQEEVLELICKTSGVYNIDTLRDKNKTPQNEINNIIYCIKEALNRNFIKGEDIDIEELSKISNDYKAALKTKISINEAQRFRNDGLTLSKRIGKYFGLGENYDITKDSPENVKKYIRQFFVDYFERLKNKGIKSPELERMQLRTFGHMLLSSNEEEQKILKEAVKCLLNDNIEVGLDAYFENTDSLEQQQALHDNFNAEDYMELEEPDIAGNERNPKLVQRLRVRISQGKTAEGAEQFENELNETAVNFYNENKEILENIENKIKDAADKKGSSLTDEEINNLLTDEEKTIYRKAKESFPSIHSAHMVGTSINAFIDDSKKEELLSLMNNNAYNLPNYRTVLEKIAGYFEENGGIENYADAKTLIDNATNGNLSAVINDINNGTTTELKQPDCTENYTKEKNTETTHNVTSNTVNNIDNNNSAKDNNKTDKDVDKAAEQNTDYNTVAEAITNEGIKGFIKYAKEVGIVAAIIGVFKDINSIHDQGSIRLATRHYEDNKDKQEDILHDVAASALTFLLQHTSYETYAKLDPESFNTYHESELVKNALEDISKRNQALGINDENLKRNKKFGLVENNG